MLGVGGFGVTYLAWDSHLEPQFRAADTNADGYISMREFLQVHRMQLERKK